MKRIDFEGQTHEFPDDFTDADIAAALGRHPAGTISATPPARPSIGSLLSKYLPLPRAELSRKPALTPENVGEGIQSLTRPSVALPLLAGGASGLGPAAARVGLTGAGALAERPEEGLTGAAKTAAPVAALEAVMPALAWLGRTSPMGQAMIRRDDTRRIGQAIGEISPPLAGRETGREIFETATGAGRKALGANKEATVTMLEHAGVPEIREASEALTALGKIAPHSPGYGSAAQGIRKDIRATSPELLPPWDEAQEAYKTGMALIGPGGRKQLPGVLHRKGAYLPTAQGPEANIIGLQKQLTDPKIVEDVTRRMGPEKAKTWIDAVTREGGAGAVDVPGAGIHVPGQQLQNPILMRMLGKILPGVGGQYAGRTPLRFPPELQSALDALAAGSM